MKRLSAALLASVILLVSDGCIADDGAPVREHVSLKREVLSPDRQVAARYYVKMGGGAAGWVDEVVDIKAVHDSTPPVNKQAVFVMSHDGDVTMR